MKCDIGVFGLSVMGQNLALNIASKGFRCAVFNRTTAKVTTTVERACDEGNIPIEGFMTVESFVQGISVPRKIIIMVQAGNAVDAVLEHLCPLLSPGDLVIDGGNEWYRNTEKRAALAAGMKIYYMGMGVSGGEEGARHGPSLMPGGSEEGYKLVEPILLKVAAKSKSGVPCVAYMGRGGSGNYVKMVHNGIEYADMQMIAEAYDILHRVGGLGYDELSKIFAEWNKSNLSSFLIEITSQILATPDDLKKGHYLLESISDHAASKGTGKWTVQESAERSTPCPAIASALDLRNLSSNVVHRSEAASAFSSHLGSLQVGREELVKLVYDALLCSKIMAYTQGFALLKAASDEEGWNLNLSNVAQCWQGGCIIRAAFLDDIVDSFMKHRDISLLAAHPFFRNQITEKQRNWRRLIALMVTEGVPVTAMASSLSYFDTLRADRLPTNLVQAQRDFFGAHEFRRNDRAGSFHQIWTTAHKATPEAQVGQVKDRSAEAR